MAMVWDKARNRFVRPEELPAARAAVTRPPSQAEIYTTMWTASQRGRRQSETSHQAFTRYCQENPAEYSAYRVAG